MNHHHNCAEDADAGAGSGVARRIRLAERRLDVGQLLDLPVEPLTWRCDRLAADGYVTVLTGEGGEGKSFLTLALAKAVAEGTSAAGVRCQAGRSVIFDAENGTQLMARRLKAAAIPRKGVAVYDADGFDIRRDLSDFASAIREERADFVVLDSLRILAPGAKESEADDMAPVMTAVRRLARETMAAIVVVHHRGKGEKASDYRGSSVIRDQADMLFVLGRNKADDQARTRRYLKTSKCRIDFEPDTRWLSVETDAVTGAVAIQPAEGIGHAGASVGTKREALAEELRPHLLETPRSRAELARAVSREPNDGQVHRALGLLRDSGFAQQTDQGWSTASHPADPQGAGWMDGGATVVEREAA
jgi:archaellum biogenesis ATPase FlaH